jgi:hypothetical protein
MTINWLAVLAATIAAFVLGGLWYSPLLFAKAWQRAAGVSDETLGNTSMPLVFGLAFFFTLVVAANLAFFVNGVDLTMTLAYSLAAGFGWATLGLGVVALFERRPPAYFLINGGYLTLAFLLMGLIIGLWR